MHSKAKVLIVDDEERFRQNLKKLLAVKNIEANSVGSAREAFEELRSNAYDVILLDIKMPEMNGIEALSEIKKIDQNLEVIILTGHASVDVAVEIMRLGGYEYLLKPCPIDELIEKIDLAYDRKVDRENRARRASSIQTDPAS
jgi:DNA-binding NtrC family response regulator